MQVQEVLSQPGCRKVIWRLIDLTLNDMGDALLCMLPRVEIQDIHSLDSDQE